MVGLVRSLAESDSSEAMTIGIGRNALPPPTALARPGGGSHVPGERQLGAAPWSFPLVADPHGSRHASPIEFPLRGEQWQRVISCQPGTDPDECAAQLPAKPATLPFEPALVLLARLSKHCPLFGLLLRLVASLKSSIFPTPFQLLRRQTLSTSWTMSPLNQCPKYTPRTTR